MIPAPANVLGRLSTIVMDYENLVAGSPRNNLHRGIAEFLKLYYDGRTELPPDETNGNNPVSRYKVATDSWRQLDRGLPAHRRMPATPATRDLVAKLLPTGKPAHTRDLAAQTIGLCLIDPRRKARRADPGQCRAAAVAPARRTATGRSSSTRTTRSPRCRPARACTPWPSPASSPIDPAMREGSSRCLAGSRRSAAGST